MTTIETFFDAHGVRLWSGKYLHDCGFMVRRLSDFRNNKYKEIGEYKAADLYAFIDHLSAQGLKNNTVNRYLAAFSALFNLAADFELVDRVPKVRWKPVEPGRPRFFSDQEVNDLIEFFMDSDHPWMADFVSLGVNTGMRLGEILSINNVTSKKTVGTISHCGGFVELTQTKNGEQRTVPLNQEAKAALENLEYCPSGVYSHRKFYDTWDAARMSIAPFDNDFVFHVLRHTCATRLAMEFNVDTIVVGTILGHRSIATTKKYVHAKKDSLANIMSKLEAPKGRVA